MALALVPAAGGSAGLRYRGAGNDNGSRAFLSGSAANNSSGLVFASVTVQNDTPVGAPTAGMQMGFLKETSGYNTDCGTGTAATVDENIISVQYHCADICDW